MKNNIMLTMVVLFGQTIFATSGIDSGGADGVGSSEIIYRSLEEAGFVTDITSNNEFVTLNVSNVSCRLTDPEWRYFTCKGNDELSKKREITFTAKNFIDFVSDLNSNAVTIIEDTYNISNILCKKSLIKPEPETCENGYCNETINFSCEVSEVSEVSEETQEN